MGMNREVKRYLEKIKKEGDSVSINLLLTLQCNFECDRCFYFSSPSMPKGYMSNEILSAVHDQLEFLAEHEIGATVNLIGGEPTLNMKEFERVFERVTDWYDEGLIYSVEMTTNGWWLKDVKHTREFLTVIARHTPGWGIDDGFTCRISSSQYHDAFRDRWLQGKGKLANRLAAIWNPWEHDEEFRVLSDEKRICNVCYEDWEENDEWMCAACGEGSDWDYEMSYEFPWHIPNPEDDLSGGWIYVDEQRDFGATIQSGKAAVHGIGEDRSEFCRSNILSYKPDGVLNDVCCRGSDLPVGMVHDNPVKLLWLASRFFKEAKPTCAGCAEDAREWMEENGLVAPPTTLDLITLR